MPTIQVEKVEFYEPGTGPAKFADGAVWFIVLSPREGNLGHTCLAHPNLTHRYERLPFSRTPSADNGEGGKHVPWGWNGDHASLTVHGSMGAFPGMVPGGRDYNAHLHFNQGRIELCSDATVTVHPSPTPCRFPEEDAGAPDA